MIETISSLSIEGFKSIRKLENFRLLPLNVLIGANGAGKSNLVGFFRLLREMIDQRLQRAVAIEGGADACLHLGPKVTRHIVGELFFGRNKYRFELIPTVDNRLVFEDEVTVFYGNLGLKRQSLGSGHAEAKLRDVKDDPGVLSGVGIPRYVFDAISSWVVYHFHDTSSTAGVRRQGAINDNEFLRPDASNLAAFLYRVRQTHPASYEKIRKVVRLAAPFFDDFKLRPVPDKPELTQLEWLQEGSDYPFRPSQLSDGTLRFMCLATALLQVSRPSVMLFDEPELGLHPYALTLLGSLLKQATTLTRQVIVSTQSAQLLNQFAPEDVIVVERAQGELTFRRLDSSHLSNWLEEYTLGDLWLKNVLGGRPRSEQLPADEAPSIPG